MIPPVPQFPEISGYTITEQLYLSSKTSVYRGIQNNQQLPVVIKVLRREYPTFRELVQFRNQYAITKNASIAGIVTALSLEPFIYATKIQAYMAQAKKLEALKIGLEALQLLGVSFPESPTPTDGKSKPTVED